ncbi:hypothetical protein R6Q59_005297 [Mikania micrantha]
MRGAVFVAVAAAVGNMIQGWDNACIAGAVLYIKKEFNLQNEPTIEDGLGIGLAVTLVPVYISETSPPEIRGSLNTLPQFMGSGGMFLSYCMVFGMSLMESPNWRLMLGVLSVPSLFYFVFTLVFLPESPRWLVSKGRMLEARHILQRLRGRDDVAGKFFCEMALLVEGLGVGGETSIEEYIIGASLIARAISSRQGSMNYQTAPFVDPLVNLFSSVHEKLPDGVGSKGSTFFPHFGSMFSANGNPTKPEDWDEESVDGKEGDDYQSDHAAGNDSDDNLHSPLISRQDTSLEKDTIKPASYGFVRNINNGEQLSSTDIGGGWQLAWKLSTKDGQDAKKEGGFERIYLHQEIGADTPADGESFQAAALVSHPALYSKDLMNQHLVGPAMVHPAKATKGPSWSDLFEPGVQHALLVGIGLQILQQFSGINGVLYYTPQILEEAGVGILLSNLGISSTSSSLLISNITTLLMLPCIAVAMRLMDISGRR